MLQTLIRPLMLAAFLALVSAPADARRELRFDAYAVPASGTIALAVAEGDDPGAVFAEIDAANAGALRRAVAAAAFQGKPNTQLDLPGIGRYDRVLLVGIGSGPVTPRVLEDVGGAVGQMAARSPAERIELLWAGTEPDAAAHLAFGADLGQYRFDTYRMPPTDMPVTGQGDLVIRTPAGAAAAERYRAQWQPVAEAVRFARDLVTEPGNVLYPEAFVERTRAAFRGVPGVSIEVLDVPAMQELGMGGILSVGQGSARPPRLLLVRYDGGTRGEPPLAFVGKGITFDTGGVSLKPNDGMWRMKTDMGGAAAVTGAVLALAARRAPVNAVAVAALAENMPSGMAARPGDVVRTAAGRTFEITSTDAEGRMVLVDALWYVQRQYRPRVVIDVATLTGAVVTALGDDYAGLFSRDDALAAQLTAAGEASGEAVWRLPLHPSYARDIQSPIADVRHSGGRGAGAGIGAHFIGTWVDEGVSWAHLDIAGMAWFEDSIQPTVPPGATAFGVRLLDRFVRDVHE
ncbi:leucyl aminopeptidase [Coralloluteibacterium thermophilus]|uniref:Probable cytosol aminopeptidase n=1 Tax=Coralloluteibacterium thermophilum TaxID=2707049 RepID=A0ABV9NLH8_9GAMM